MEEFGFIIPSYCENDVHLFQLNRCLESVRKFHDNTIIVVDDYSISDINSVVYEYDNVKIIKSPIKGAGDMVTYDIFKNDPIFKKAVIFQDSMKLEKKLDNVSDIENISFIWYFTNHRLHWSHIKEPRTEYNIKNNILVHDDAIIDVINKGVTNESFKKFALDIYHKKNEWNGCFGCSSIIDIDFVNRLEKETGMVSLLKKFNNNRLRRVAESLFGISCLYVLGEDIFEKAYDGLYYDGVNINSGAKNIKASEIGMDNNSVTVYQVCRKTYFSKLSFNRNA